MKKNFEIFISQLTTSYTLPSSLAFLIELLSNLQITHLIFITMSDFVHEQQFVLNSLSKNLPFFTGAFHLNPSSQLTGLLTTFLALFIAYLILHICLIIAAFYQISQYGALNKTLTKIMACFYLLHSRIIFFPCQFFLSNLASYYSNHEYNEFYQSTGWLVTLIIFSVINFALAILKEFLLYQITQTNDIYSIKSNIFHKITLIYKAVLILVLVHGQNSRVLIQITSIFHFLFCNGLYISVRRKLPFYDFYLLRQIVAHTILNWCFAFLSIIQVFATSDLRKLIGSVDILIFLFPVLILKFGFLRFKNQFEKILQGEFNSPEYTIHYGVLLEKLAFQDRNSNLHSLGFLPNQYQIAGALASKTSNLYNKDHIYEHIVDKLEGALNDYPRSEVLLVYLADIYLSKLKNVARFLQVFRTIQGMNCSRFCRKAVEDFYEKLDEIYNEDLENSLSRAELKRCFVNSHLVNSVNENILKEIEYHMKVWKDIENQEVDMQRTVDYALAIDKIHLNLLRQFEKNTKNSQQRTGQILLLTQIVYLNNVRSLIHETRPLIKLFQLKFPSHGHDTFQPDKKSLPTAFIVISLDKKSPGLILDASGPIDSIFNTKKSALLKQNFSCLFPTTIAKVHQTRIQEYAKNPTYKMDHKCKTYGKTSQGEIFELEAHFQLYCHLKQEIAVVVQLSKISEPQMIFIANTEGVITDCSFSLTKGLNIKTQRMIQDIAFDLENVNRAYNIVYRNQEASVFQLPKSYEEYQSIEDSTRVFKGDSILMNPRPSYRSEFGDYDTSRPLRPSVKLSFLEYSHHLETIQQQKEKDYDEEEILKATKICEEYAKGKTLLLRNAKYAEVEGCLSKKEGIVKVTAFVFHKEIYKIITLSNFKHDDSNSLDSLDKPSGNDEVNIKEEDSDMTFADEFPISLEVHAHQPKTENSSPKKSFTQPPNPNTAKSSSFTEKLQPHFHPLHQAKTSTNQPSSERENLKREMRISRALHQISTSNNLAPRLKAVLSIVYASMFLIFLMSILNCLISHHAIKQVQIGLNIVSISTDKVTWSINLWQDALNLYLVARSPGAIDSNSIAFYREDITTNAENLKSTSTALVESLSDLNPFTILPFLGHALKRRVNVKSLLQQIYQKNIHFYNPPSDVTPSDQLNLLIASDLLISKYTIFTNPNSLLLQADQPPAILNNTINDYMVQSRNLIIQTEAYLQDLINSSIKSSHTILAVDIAVLFLFCLVLLILGLLGIMVYGRLFRALLKIKQESISEQITRLERARTLFSEDIESTNFSENALGIILYERPQRTKPKKSSAQRAVKITGKSSTKAVNLHLMRIVLMSVMWTPVLGGLFSWSVSDSIESFKVFRDLTSQVTVLSQATYYSFLLVNTFSFETALYGIPDMRVLNKNPKEISSELLKSAQDVNTNLAGIFINGDDKEVDGFTMGIIQDNACPIFNEEYEEEICLSETAKYGSKGLYALNVKYLEITQNYLWQFQQAETFSSMSETLENYRNDVSNTRAQIQDGFPELAGYILNDIEKKSKRSLRMELIFLGCLVGFVALYTGFLYGKALKRFIGLDLGRRRVVKVIPYRVVQENKALSFYVIRTFGQGNEMIKNIL